MCSNLKVLLKRKTELKNITLERTSMHQIKILDDLEEPLQVWESVWWIRPLDRVLRTAP